MPSLTLSLEVIVLPCSPELASASVSIWDVRPVHGCVFTRDEVTCSFVPKFQPNYQAFRPWILLGPSAIRSSVKSNFGLQSQLSYSL